MPLVQPRPGFDGFAGTDASELLLKVFAGEVFTSFKETNKMLPLTRIKNVSGQAISWTFPVVGTAMARYHVPGTNILTDASGAAMPQSGSTSYLNKILQAQRTINMDRALTASVFVDKLDQKLAHWDVMSAYSKELGNALGRTVDYNISRMIYNIGNATADTNMTIFGTTPVGPAGGGTFGSSRLAIGAFANVTPAILQKALSDMKVRFDKKNVPTNDRYAVMAPEVMQRLLMDANGVPGGTAANLIQWVNSDFNTSANGSFATGKVPMLHSFKLIEHNNVDFNPSTATYGVYDFAHGYIPSGAGGGTAGDDDNLFETVGNLPITFNSLPSSNDYSAAYTATAQAYVYCFQKEAIGTVKLEDTSVEQEYKIEYRGNLIVASWTGAHGVLRPECVGLICHT